MRIVQVSDYFPDYGAHVVDAIAHRLASWGHEVLVLAGTVNQDGHQYPKGWQQTGEGFRVYRFRSFGARGAGTVLSIPGVGLLQAVDIIRKFKPNVANLHFVPHLGNVAIAPFLKIDHTPTIFTIHGVPMGYTSRALKASSSIINGLARLPIQLATRVIAVSEQVCNAALRTYMIDRTRIQVIPNGIDVNKFQPLRRRFIGRTIRVGFCGRLASPKRVDLLIRGVVELRDKFGIETLGLIAGEGPARGELQKLAHTLSAPIEFLGHITSGATPGFYNELDALVLLSANEGLPQTVLEAMSCGLPVIASGVGGIQDVISDRFNGMILRSSSPSALAHAIVELVKENGLTEAISRNSRETILNAYSDETMCKRYLRTYEEAASESLLSVRTPTC